MVVIPHIKQIISGIIIHGGDVLVRVWEKDVQIAIFAQLRVVDVVDFIPSGFAIVVFIDALNHVQDSTDHKSIGSGTFVVGRIPCSLHPKCVRVQLADHNPSVVLFRGINHPKSVLVHCQIDIRLAAPTVWRRIVVVRAGNDGLTALDASAQIELDDIPRALLVEEQRAVVDDKPGAVHPMGKFVGGRGSACNEVLFA